jgi:3-isopropylmalate/(R)-2-methylmalate dehydratase small subunit
MIIEGRAIRLGDDVNTDNILPGPYLNLTDPQELGRHLLETYPGDVGARLRHGDILVAGENFGMGSSREHAQQAILGRGIQAIVAASFARIFLRNCVNVAIPAVESAPAAAAIADGQIVRIDLARGVIVCDGGRFAVPATPPFLADLTDAGGLVPWTQRRLHARRTDDRSSQPA